MEQLLLEVFSETSNYGIVRMPDRSSPGVVIQGGSLAILCKCLRSIHDRAVRAGDAELVEEVAELGELLEDRLRHYEQVLVDHGINLPYSKGNGWRIGLMRERVAVHPVVDEEGGRRIAIFRRGDGGYMYAEEQRVCLPGTAEPTWTSEFDHDTRSGVYDSIETTLQEAERDVLWLNRRLRLRRRRS